VTKDSILFYYEKERVFYPKAGERSFYHLEKVMPKSKALTFYAYDKNKKGKGR